MYKGQRVAAVVVAAGRSRRMGFDKLLYPIGGVEVLRRSVGAMAHHPYVDEVVVVTGDNHERVKALFAEHPAPLPLRYARGGASRASSVLAGVALCEGADIVAIHDAARPFVSAEIISRTVEAAAEVGAGAPAIPVKDTIKDTHPGGEYVSATPLREHLFAVQTPQTFRRGEFLEAFARQDEADYPRLTDDCTVMELAGRPVKLVQGEEANLKITTPADLPEKAAQPPVLRVGHGYDVHRLVEGRPLILGGVTVPYEKGLDGHSDADVLLHAVCDALLGAAALGDIGVHFPDTDPAYKGADSLRLLQLVGTLLVEKGWSATNVDATLLCQKPKLAPYIPAMRENIAGALGLGLEAVSVKATTEEGLGFTGTGQGIAAHCVVLLES